MSRVTRSTRVARAIHGPDLVETVLSTQLGADEVLLKPALVAISDSDITMRRHSAAGGRILGREMVGEVLMTSERVAAIEPGELVAFNPYQENRPGGDAPPLGDTMSGAFCELLRVPASVVRRGQLVRVPPGLGRVECVLAAMVARVRRSLAVLEGALTGARLALVGRKNVGVARAYAVLASAEGAREVTTFEPGETPAPSAAFDVVVVLGDCSSAALASALSLVRKGGVVQLIPDGDAVPPRTDVGSARVVQAGWAMEEDFTASFSQIQAGALRASDLVSHVVSFDRVPTYLDFLERGVENARAETVRGVVVDFRLNDADLAIEDYQRLLHFVGDTWRPRPALSAAYPDETRRAFVLKERVAEQLRVNCARATLDPEQERKLNVAFQIAFAAHRNPLPGSEVHRSDGLSFVLHCTRVALYLVRTVRTADAELIAAAFVHDVLEHTTLGLSELRESLGEGSDAIVDIAEDLSQSSYLTRGPLPETLVRQVAERLGDPSVRSLLVERSDDENPDSLRRLLVKVEHFQRLLQRAKDPRSPLLKVVDNLISYDTSAYSPRAVPRTRTELALFRYFVENGPVVRDHPAVAREALLVVEQLAAPNLLAQEWSAVVPQLKLLLAMKFEPTVG